MQAQYLDFSKIQIFQKSSIFGQASDFGNLYLKILKIDQGEFFIYDLKVFGQPEKQSEMLFKCVQSHFFCRWLRQKLKILDEVIHQGRKISKKCFNLPVSFF